MSVASYVGVVPAQLSPLRVDSARAAAESGGEDPFAQLEAALACAPRVHPDTAAATGLPEGFRGGCREEQKLGKLRGIDGGVDGSIFGGALPRHSQRRIQHRSQRHAQELFRRLTP